MKNLFRKLPMRTIEDQIAHFTKRGEQLDAMRAKAKDTLDQAVAAQQDRLLSGDIDDQRALGDLRDAVVLAQVELASIENALTTLARQKSDAEAKLATEREHADRITASAESSRMRARISGASVSMVTRWLRLVGAP